MPEWLNGAVSKTVVRYAYRGFESLSLRCKKIADINKQNVLIFLFISV